jgi:hypothetical protein
MMSPPDGWGFLAKMKNLYQLDLSNSSFATDDVQYLVDLPIEVLEMKQVDDLTDRGVRQLCSISTLKFLDLGHCPQVSDDGLKELPPNLIFLNCSGDHLNGTAIPYLAQLSHLHILFIHDCGLTKKDADSLKELKTLEYLNIANNQIDPDTLDQIRKSLPQCAVVTKSDTYRMSTWLKENHVPVDD